MNKKGQGQLVAFVLLIGFTVVIGIMVGDWAIQKAKKTSANIVERGEIDVRCADVQINPICEGTSSVKMKNNGKFKVKLKSNNQLIGDWIYPGDTSNAIILNNQTVIPFIKIDGKEFGCPNRDQKLDVNICV